MLPFQYDPEILKRFTLLAGGAMSGVRLHNGPTPPGIQNLYLEEQKRVLQRIGTTPLSEIESLAGWRAAFRLFGVDPTQYRSASEALLRRLTKKGDIPSINTVVDLCNLVSIRYALPVAAFDLRLLQPPITVHFATGNEAFRPLGEAAPEHPEPGEVVFSDAAGVVVARRWCWRQSQESAAQEDAETVLFTIEAQHAGGRLAVESALSDLQKLLSEYAGGEYKGEMVVG
jgi:DNA/RNA-binding domain of Phe-tRNA-synthetase-like protein